MFTKAVKTQAKLRCALFGSAGTGKTFSALAIASGMSDKIALIDTENFSASLYSDDFDFDILNLQNKTIEGYINAIHTAAEEKYEVLIIDSLSHAWKELLMKVETLTNSTKYKGNSWRAWGEGTPLQQKLINAVLNYPGHLMITMRTKTEWALELTEKGKNRPVRIGLAPEQGKGIEYEFDILMEISPDHFAHIIKDRTSKFQDKIIEKPGKEFGKTLSEWLNSGKEIPEENLPITDKQQYKLAIEIGEHAVDIDKMFLYYGISHIRELTKNHFENALKTILSKPERKFKGIINTEMIKHLQPTIQPEEIGNRLENMNQVET